MYSSGDYAEIGTENFQAYYGYEVTDDNDEWCFQATFNNETITIPFSKLKGDDYFDCKANLLIGIGWLLMKYKLSL